ncbi:hypothetical protein [Saccharothrix luteola]|uniref:hypothetical protein n=1 Tax=Saccharothrix luteola TaxID=2893018 RepID=UPI0027E25B2D|nr:hypothetical protein [Saccharothrix luteola]
MRWTLTTSMGLPVGPRTLTMFEPVLATCTRPPGVTETPRGASPTLVVRLGRLVLVSMTVTVSLPVLAA